MYSTLTNIFEQVLALLEFFNGILPLMLCQAGKSVHVSFSPQCLQSNMYGLMAQKLSQMTSSDVNNKKWKEKLM